MRKHIIDADAHAPAPEDAWLDLEQLAQVEITSEASDHPIEAALVPRSGAEWRAAQPGPQTIRVRFDQPQRLRRIWLLFIDPTAERTHEFVLRWSADGGTSFHEIARQQWNFSPQGAPREVEDYTVDLAGVTVLELNIIPDIHRRGAVASLTQLRVA